MKRFSVVAVPAIFLASVSCNSGSLSIDTQPADQSIAVGQTATFSVVATGTAPLTYQWQLNDAPIAGATQASTTTAPATTADSGSKYRVVVTDSSGSVTSNEAKLTVTASSGPQTLTVHAVDRTGLNGPAFLAFQDGDGPWQSVTHVASGDYSFTVSADRYGLAMADAVTSPSAPIGYVIQATVSEQPALTVQFAGPPRVYSTAVATIANLPDGGVGMASIVGCGISDNTGHVACPHVEVGTYDALGVAGNKVVFKPDLEILELPPNASNDLGLFDFNVGGSTKVTHMVTVHGLPPNASIKSVGGFRQRFGKTGEDLTFFDPGTGIPTYIADANGDVTYPITLLPYAQIAKDTLELFTISSRVSAKGSEHSSAFFVQEYFNSPDDQALTYPADFSSTDASFGGTTPYARVQADWSPVASLPVYRVTIEDAHLKWTEWVTRGWLGGASDAHYVFPDLSAATGWTSALQYPSGDGLLVAVSGGSYVDLNTTLATMTDSPLSRPKVGDFIVNIVKGPTVLTVP